jgi:hypothetical protein
MTTTLLEPPTVLAGGKPPNRFDEGLVAPPGESDVADGDSDTEADVEDDLDAEGVED